MSRAFGLGAFAAVAATLLVGPATGQATSHEPDWILLLDARGAAPGNPWTAVTDLPLTLDPRLDVETVEARLEPATIALRLTTRSGTPADPSASVESVLAFGVHSPHLGSSVATIRAVDDAFTVSVQIDPIQEASEPQLVEGRDVVVEEGSTAWQYTLTIRRSALLDNDGTFIRGDRLVDVMVDTYDAQGLGGDHQEARPDLLLPSSGGYAPGELADRTSTRWYQYPMRADADSASSLAAGTTLHAASVLRNSFSYYARDGEPEGLYHFELVDGGWAESFVASVGEAPAGLQGSPADLVVGLAVVDNEPHVLFHPEPAAGSGRDGALRHAWREAGTWTVEDVPVPGSIYVDYRSTLPVAASGDRLVTAVRLADGSGSALLEHDGSGWRTLTTFTADMVTLAFSPAGRLHVGAYWIPDDAEPSTRSMATLRVASEADGFELGEAFTGLEDNNAWWSDAALSGSYAMAVGPDERVCLFVDRLDASVWQDGPSGHATFQCGDDSPETISFLHSDSAPLLLVRMAIGPDGTAHVLTGYGRGEWYGQRSPDGTWWWEFAGDDAWNHQIGNSLTLLGSQAAVGGAGTGFSEAGVALLNPTALDQTSQAFYIGTAADSVHALAPYRQAATGTGADAAASAPDASAPVSAAGQQTTGDEGDDAVGAPGPGFVGLLAMLAAGLAVALRRRPQQP